MTHNPHKDRDGVYSVTVRGPRVHTFYIIAGGFYRCGIRDLGFLYHTVYGFVLSPTST